jgi:hypothetical protein
MNKICKKCKIEKDINLFRLINSKSINKTYYCAQCIACEKIYQQSEGRIFLNKLLYIKNKTTIIATQTQYMKRRRKNDVSFRLANNVSRSINKAIKIHGSSKSGKLTFKHLPYSKNELKAYLEKQFETWMTWENYGIYDGNKWDDNDQSTWTWNIDHIVPHSTFNYISMDDQKFKDCWALKNLRPYSAKQNWIDGTNRFRHNRSE